MDWEGLKMIATLEKSISREVVIPLLGYRMRARLEQPMPSRGIVVFANGFGSARFHPGNRIVADALESADFATLMVDLLAPQEEEDPQFIFDTSLPARRLGNVIRWLKRSQEYQDWPIGVFGSGTGTAAILEIAACMPEFIEAVVARGGRPDLAETWLPMVEAPTELIVGSEDHHILEVNWWRCREPPTCSPNQVPWRPSPRWPGRGLKETWPRPRGGFEARRINPENGLRSCGTMPCGPLPCRGAMIQMVPAD
jgi:dienelactone hydrolase